MYICIYMHRGPLIASPPCITTGYYTYWETTATQMMCGVRHVRMRLLIS